ncbi:MAG: hypothetical protein VCD00_10835 [Candidatus Hydrogenedentota bacterium]
MNAPIAAVKRSRMRIVAPLLVVIAALPTLGMLQHSIDTMHDAQTANEMLYFPNDKLLRHFTAGLDNIVADFMWYRTVQYVGEEFLDQTVKGSWLAQMVTTTTKLSPHHVDAFRYGGSLLAAIGSDEEAMKLLKEGFYHNPDSWTIPYEMHSVYLMNRREEPNANLLASRYAYLVGERHEPEYRSMYFELSQKLLERENMHAEAVAFFRDKVARAKDPMLRSLAEAQLRIAIIERNLDTLNLAAEHYASTNGTFPNSLQALVNAELVNALPSDPLEGKYYIDEAHGQVRNETIQRQRKDRLVHRINNNLQTYLEAHNTYPDSLETLWAWEDRDGVPYPFPGGDWIYDPVTGKVR